MTEQPDLPGGTSQRLPDRLSDPVPEWVAEAVGPAVAELVEHGVATVTARGAPVRASLRRPAPGKPGWLNLGSESVNGSTGGGTIVERASEEELRGRIPSGLVEVVTEFVDQ